MPPWAIGVLKKFWFRRPRMEMMQLGFRVWGTIALHVFTRLPTKAQQREGGTLKMTLTLVCSTLIIATSFSPRG